LQVYPTGVASCGARLALFSWRFLIPLCFFVFCYWKIISALRRCARVAYISRRTQSTIEPSTSTADTAAAGSRSNPLSKTERNVIRTMLIVISCFSACWLPFQFTLVIESCGQQPVSGVLYYVFALFASVTPCANPFIYAYGMFQHATTSCDVSLCRVKRRQNQVSNG